MLRLVFVLVLLCPVSAWALQIDQPGWSFNQRIQGSSYASGTILKSDTTVGYTLDRYMNLYAGLPLYFSRPDSAVSPGADRRFLNGVGNLYLGLQVPVQGEIADYTSDLVVMAPTGSKDRGLNTGRVTFDWTNDIRRALGPVTPFGIFGIANTISDNSFFIRPFTSLGLVGHFEGGAVLGVAPMVNVGGSAYSVRSVGTQRVISRVVDRPFVRGHGPGLGRNRRTFETTPEVRVPAEFLNEHGFATWVGVNPQADLAFQVGYSRNFPYEYDSLFFGVGFKIGSLKR